MKTKSAKVSYIKLLICIGFIICTVCTASAQSNLPKYDNEALVVKPRVIKSSATGNHAERKVTVKVTRLQCL